VVGSKIRISVIIPVYNASTTIIQCLESVIKQTKPVYEIIVIDDGSTDNTLFIVTRFKESNKIDNLIIISQSNSGPSKARNKGIKKAVGNWIAFLDSDDKWLPDKIEKQVAVIEQNKDVSIIGTAFLSKDKNYYKKSEQIGFKKMLFKNRFLTSTVLVRKEVVSKFLFDEKLSYAEDQKLWLNIIYLYKGVVINEGLAIYAENQNKYRREALSNNLCQMEKGELGNFFYLYNQKMINLPIFLVISSFSILKHIRRVLLYYINHLIDYK